MSKSKVPGGSMAHAHGAAKKQAKKLHAGKGTQHNGMNAKGEPITGGNKY
jgi:hypothetical protein